MNQFDNTHINEENKKKSNSGIASRIAALQNIQNHEKTDTKETLESNPLKNKTVSSKIAALAAAQKGIGIVPFGAPRPIQKNIENFEINTLNNEKIEEKPLEIKEESEINKIKEKKIDEIENKNKQMENIENKPSNIKRIRKRIIKKVQPLEENPQPPENISNNIIIRKRRKIKVNIKSENLEEINSNQIKKRIKKVIKEVETSKPPEEGGSTRKRIRKGKIENKVMNSVNENLKINKEIPIIECKTENLQINKTNSLNKSKIIEEISIPTQNILRPKISNNNRRPPTRPK